MLNNLVSGAKALLDRMARELDVYRRVITHPRTPWLPRLLLGAAVAYFVSPIDVIPDVIPVLGQLDDLLIVPGLLWLAFRLLPPDVIEECRRMQGEGQDEIIR
jgi:uncharacterized membrane protein YkvA (DUF1232 family)